MMPDRPQECSLERNLGVGCCPDSAGKLEMSAWRVSGGRGAVGGIRRSCEHSRLCAKEGFMNAPPRSLVPCLIAVVFVSATVGSSGIAQAAITKIQITTIETPTFGGYSWPSVGQYEKIVGKAFGEVDPLDPKNTVIVDIELAPRNSSGNVEYSFDFYILKP